MIGLVMSLVLYSSLAIGFDIEGIRECVGLGLACGVVGAGLYER